MRTKALITIFCGLIFGSVLASNPMFRVLSNGGGSGATPTPTATPSTTPGPTITTSGNWEAIGGTTTVVTPTRTLTGSGTVRFHYSGSAVRASKNGGAFVAFANNATLAIASGDTLRMEITAGAGAIGTLQDNSNFATIGTIDIENTNF